MCGNFGLVYTRLNKISLDAVFTKRLERLQTVKTFKQHKPVLVCPEPDWCCLTDLDYTFCNLFDFRWVQGFLALHGHVDFGNAKGSFLQHGNVIAQPAITAQVFQQGFNIRN